MVGQAFIVGTGRCGSTLLSNILNDHPEILSLSEFFSLVADMGSRIDETFPEGDLEAKGFWENMGGLHPHQNTMLRHGVAMGEVLYPCLPSSRYSAQTGVPAILQAALPHLTDDHDALFDELKDFALSRPRSPARDHYTAAFDFLAGRFGCAMWAERSGGSLRVIRLLYSMFPEAKFVHIVRDGRDCAISMQNHLGFRMVLLGLQLKQALGIDPFVSDDRTKAGGLPDHLRCFLPENFDAETFRNFRPPATLFGRYWSGEIATGMEVLRLLPENQKLTLRYEDFLAEPEDCTRRLVGFLRPNFSDETWIKKQAARILPPSSSWRKLPESQQEELTKACAPGFELLAQDGLVWHDS